MSVNDTSNNVPVLQQINSLNSQPIMQVRRPSDLNSSFTPVDSQHSTHNIQKSPLCTSGVLDGRTTPLNLINEESSVNEQSDNKAFENLINKKPLPQILDFIIKEPVHWSQIFTHSCTHKNNDQFTKFGSYLGDKAYTQQNIQQDLQFNIKPAIIIIQVIIYFYFLYQFPLLLYGLAYEDYNLIYQAQIQASFLILNLILFVLNFHKTSQYLDYMPLATLIPFICAFTDINQKLIFVQIIHLVAFIRFYQVFKQLLQVSICLRQYSIYFFAVRISQIHLFQIICGFLIVITSKVNQNQLGLNEFYQNYCSLINILIISYNQSFLVYPIKMTVFIFIIYQYAIIVDQINYLCKDQNTLISGLNELSKLIKSLPFDLRYESLLISNSQIQSRLKTRNLIDYDKLPILLSYKLLNEQYSKILRKLPLIDKCLSNTTIINVLMNATKERIIESNEILIEAQKENKFLYFVLSGKVKCYQQRNNQSFQIANNENEIYNQYGFFLDQQSEVVVQSDTCCKVLEINSELFWKEVKKSISEHQKVKMFLDRVQYNQEYKLIGVSCQICQGNHKIDNCKKIHYVPSRQMLMNYIYFDEINKRQKFQRRNHTRKFRCIKNNGMIEQIVCNFRHLMLPQSDTFKRPKTITSIGMYNVNKKQFNNIIFYVVFDFKQNQLFSQQLEQLSQHSDEEEIHKMSQQVQNLSPVQYVPQVGSSASSYVLKELKQAQQLKSSKNSFMVHQKRYQEKRQSHVTRVERDLSPSIIKYATIQDKKSQRSKSIISEDYANGVVHSSDHRQFSKYGIQSSKFTNETAKQFMNNPFDMPLYDLNLSIDNNHSYSDYYPRNNIDQALISYRQYQDSIISNKSKQNT